MRLILTSKLCILPVSDRVEIKQMIADTEGPSVHLGIEHFLGLSKALALNELVRESYIYKPGTFGVLQRKKLI